MIRTQKITALLAALLIAAFAAQAPAMEPLTESELDEVKAAGFSSFQWEGETARAEFDIEASTWAEIDKFHAGPDPDGDQVWTDVELGSKGNDLHLSDFVFEARFENRDDMENRELRGLKIGFEDVSGQISANFEALSREGSSHRDSPGQTTYDFNNDKLIFHLNTEGSNPGIWVDFGDASAS